jgi:enamine deaminase RidA (YjgF/YER057c/UK114 family)
MGEEPATPLQRLRAMGLSLPAAPAALASYVPTTTLPVGDGRVLVFVAGQVAMKDGVPAHRGRVPDEVSLAAAQENARLVGLNILAQLEHAVGLDNVVRVLKLDAFVRSADGFEQQPAVVNAASELLVAVLGEAGRHARAAVGVIGLPGGVPVEIAAIALAREMPR